MSILKMKSTQNTPYKLYLVRPILVFAFCLFQVSIFANKDSSELKLFLSDSLEIQDINGNVLADPFSGGIESPRFFNLELNGDDKPDLVVFDRKNNKISTFLNEGTSGDAVYRHNVAFEHLFPKGRFNYYLVDIDRDGFKDIICGDIFQNRMVYYRNKGLAAPALEFENRGFLNYLHFNPPSPGVRNSLGNPIQHIHAVDDVDGDGDIDFLSISSFGGNLEYYENRQVENGLPKDSIDFHLSDLCFGYFKEGLANEVLIGQCQTTKHHTRRHAAGSSLLLLDLDKDGDKDLLLSNSGFQNILKLVNGYVEHNASYDSMISWDSIYPRNTQQAKIDEFPSASLADINGDGVNDLIVCPTWNTDEEIKGTEQTMLYLNNGSNDSFDLSYQGSNFLMSQSIDLGANASPCFYDYDGDGDQDLFVVHSGDRNLTGGIKDQIALFKNVGDKNNPKLRLSDLNFGNFSQFNLSYSHLAIYDFDEDGKYEFYLGQLDGSVDQFTNSGSNASPVFALNNSNFVGSFATSDAAISFMDYNKDGKTDIILGSFIGDISLYENTGTNQAPSFTWKADRFGKMFTNAFTNRTNPPSFEGIGRSRPLVVDMNGDGTEEIIAGSFSGKIFAWQPTENINDSFLPFQNFINFIDANDDTLTDYFFGLNTSVAAADLDNDTITDLLVFNDAGGFHYLSGKARKFVVSNPQLKKLNSQIYPNPTQELLNITGIPTGSEASIKIFDMNGRLIQNVKVNDTQLSLNLSSYKEGIYIIEIGVSGYETFYSRIQKISKP